MRVNDIHGCRYKSIGKINTARLVQILNRYNCFDILVETLFVIFCTKTYWSPASFYR